MGPLEAADTAHSDEEEAWDLETALDHVGVGRFQWTALAVCGLANASDAVEILALSLVLPAAEDDLHLTAAGKSALSSCIFIGMLIGGLVWGPMGDALGRRSTLVVSLALNGVFGMLSAAARNVSDLVFLRLVAGVGVGGSVPVVFSFLAELLPAHARGKFMVGLAAFWMVGSLYSAGLGWAMIPAVGWRIFLVAAALPAFAAAAGCLLLLPESPRYLLVHGRVGPAEKAIKRMAAANKVKLPPNVKLRQHESHLLAVAAAADYEAQSNPHNPASAGVNGSSKDVAAMEVPACSSTEKKGAVGSAAQLGPLMQHMRSALRTSGDTAMQLLRTPLRARFLPLLVAWIGAGSDSGAEQLLAELQAAAAFAILTAIGMCGGWYSTVLWIPEYFKARGAGNSSLYAESFAVAAANLPGNIASIFMVDRLGRRWTACICLAGACVAALGFAAAPADPVWSVVAACVFNAISVGGWNALDLLSAELFPTEVRSTAMGCLGATGRLASFTTTFLAGALMHLKLWAPLVVAAGLLAAGSLAMLLLPEMALRPLEDTVEDAAERVIQDNAVSNMGLTDGHGGLREMSLQGVAAAVVEGVRRQRTSSRSGAGSGAAAAAGLEEYLADSPRAARSHGRRRFGSHSHSTMSSSSKSDLKPQRSAARLTSSDPSSHAAAGGVSRGFKGLEMTGVGGDASASAAAEEGRSLLPAQREGGHQLPSQLL